MPQQNSRPAYPRCCSERCAHRRLCLASGSDTASDGCGGPMQDPGWQDPGWCEKLPGTVRRDRNDPRCAGSPKALIPEFLNPDGNRVGYDSSKRYTRSAFFPKPPQNAGNNGGLGLFFPIRTTGSHPGRNNLIWVLLPFGSRQIIYVSLKISPRRFVT